MSTTKITRLSWFDRLKSSVAGIGAGIILIIGMVAALWWNEGRAVQTHRSLQEGSGLVVSVPAHTVDLANEGQLVHISGPLSSGSELTDSDFQVSAEGVRLIRKVEMYQWIESSSTETQQSLGGGETRTTTYTYDAGWSDRHHDSSRFQEAASYYNPPMAYSGESFRLESADLNAFSVGRNVLDRVGGTEQLNLEPAHAELLPGTTQGDFSIQNGAVYLGEDPALPWIGDLRVTFEVVPFREISVVGAQHGGAITSYATQAGDSILLVSQGAVPAQEMFDSAASSNTALTWLLRFGGLLLLITGFSMMLKPLSVVASVVPFLGRIVGMGTGLVATMAGLAIATLTIALAWVAYRPVVAIIILAVGVGLILMVRQLLKNRRQIPAASAAAA